MRLFINLIIVLYCLIYPAFAQQCRTSNSSIAMLSSLADHSLASACLLHKEQFKCDELLNDLIGDEKKKVIQCDLKSIDENKLSNMSLSACLLNGVKISGAQLLDLMHLPEKLADAVVRGFHEAQLCNLSIDKKRELLTAYNLSIADSRFQLNEQFLGKWLEDASCAEVDKLLYARHQNYQNTLMRERVAAINTGKIVGAIASSQEKGQNIMVLLKNAMESAQVRYECYTPRIKAEMICAAVTSLIADAALGMGIKSAIGKIVALANSKRALGGINRAVATGEKVDLGDSSKLLASDRKKAAAKVLNKVLSPTQEKAIINAHEVGTMEGRGFFSYTRDDLRKKSIILKEAGFDDEERALLMRSGVTGQFTAEDAKQAFASSLEKNMKYGDPKQKAALLSRMEQGIRDLKNAKDPAEQANTARLLGELTQAHDAKAAKLFYQMGLDKIKEVAEKDAGYFSRTKTLDNFLSLASHAGDQTAVKRGMSVYVKQELMREGKRMGWKTPAEAANGLFEIMESEVSHYRQLGAKALSSLEATRRKQKALLEEFQFIDQTGRRMREIDSDYMQFSQNE